MSCCVPNVGIVGRGWPPWTGTEDFAHTTLQCTAQGAAAFAIELAAAIGEVGVNREQFYAIMGGDGTLDYEVPEHEVTALLPTELRQTLQPGRNAIPNRASSRRAV